MICKSCGTVRASHLPGNGLIELVMWVVVPLWPAALIYSIWRRTSRRRCASCGSVDLISLDSPAGKQLARQHYPEGLPPEPPPPRPTRVLGAALIGLGIFTVVWIL